MKKLYLSEDDKKLLGVCGGIAEYFDIDSTLVRVGWIVLTVTTAGAGALAYLVAAMVMPKKPESKSS